MCRFAVQDTLLLSMLPKVVLLNIFVITYNFLEYIDEYKMYKRAAFI